MEETKIVADQEKNSETGIAVDKQQTDYITAIKELKQREEAAKSEAEKLKSENKRLVNEVLNGDPSSIKSVEVQLPKSSDIVKQLKNENLSNREVVEIMLQLREACKAENKPDPFVPVGRQISPTDDDIKSAEKVAGIYKEMLDEANGDDAVFNNELQRRVLNIKY